jgi:Uma2 family endonuclease
MITVSASTPMPSPVQLVQPTRKKWTRVEVYRLMEAGWFENQPIELIDGEIILLPTQSPEHAYAVDEVYRTLDQLFGADYWVRMQLPLASADSIETAPDVSMVPGLKRDYTDHPSTAALIVEVAKSTLEYDRTQKSGIYAAACVPEYWVLNLKDRVLEVYRQPVVKPEHPFGHCYRTFEKIAAAGQVAPLGNQAAWIAVSRLLPPESVGVSTRS